MVTRTRPKKLLRRPSVSVVVPCYNYGTYLSLLVGRLLDEPGVDVDVLIVDDASPDGSAAVAEKLAAANNRVKTIVHRQNMGHIATYNEGLSQATGDYVVLLSADDVLPRGAIQRAVALMEVYPKVGFVYGWVQSFEGEPPADPPARIRNWSIWSGQEWLSRRCRTARSGILSPEVVMRRSAMADMVGYDARLPHSADLDLWLRTALRWDVGRVNGPAQACYRVHGANMHLTEFSGAVTDLRERRRTFELLYDEHAVARPEIVALRERSMSALAQQALRLAIAAQAADAAFEDVADYGAFASETWPDVKRTRLWRSFEASSSQALSPWAVRARQFEAKVRTHLWWRRWRRYGT